MGTQSRTGQTGKTVTAFHFFQTVGVSRRRF